MNRSSRSATSERIIGSVGERGKGPLLFVIAAMHGNEPAGVEALRRVFETVANEELTVRGRLIGVIGNVAALERSERFVDFDLNRAWSEPGSFASASMSLGSEGRELTELSALIEDELTAASSTVAFIDLHSTSGDTRPFCVLSDSIGNRRLAWNLEIPLVLGLEEEVRGSLLNHLGDRGILALGIEGGRHDARSTVDIHEAALWVLLDELDVIEVEESIRRMMRARLRDAARSQPRIIELVYRHQIEEKSDFRMAEAFEGFEHVSAGDLLAYENGIAIRSPASGVIMLPRYQPVGDDGFFIARPIRRIWLRLSTVLRRTPADRLTALIPGAFRDPTRGEEWRIPSRPWGELVLRWMHLLGFRRWPDEGSDLVFRRRPEPAFDE